MKHPEFNRQAALDFLGIPQFVEDEAYVSAFGIQWLKHAKTQLDSYTGLTITRDRLIRMFGPLYSHLNHKTILEAGCGAGRFTEILLESDSLITAVDLSVAVLVNQSNNGVHKHLRIIRASITDLPFDNNQFDIVFCPQESIEQLYKQVKPGGWLVFDQYRYNLSYFLRTAWFIRLVLRRLNPEQGLKITDWLVRFWLPLHRMCYRNRLLEIILFRISPITVHYSSYPKMKEEDQISWAQLNTHDNLTDCHKHFTTLRKLKKVLALLGATNQYLCQMPYTIEVRCQKPINENIVLPSVEPKITRLKGSWIVSG